MFIINSESNYSLIEIILNKAKKKKTEGKNEKKNQFDTVVSYKKRQTSLPPRFGRHWIQFGCGLRLLMKPTAHNILDNQNQCS